MKFAAVVGGVALACLTPLAGGAADVTLAPEPVKAAPYIPAYFYWTGFYVGATIGAGFGDATFFDPFAGQDASISIRSFLAGGYTGINYQIGSLVLGGEWDFIGSFSNSRGNDPAGNTVTSRVFWTSALTARVGWALDRLLVYGKTGAALGYQRDSALGPAIPGAPLGSVTSAGWTIGAGVDWAVTEHWIARFEYDFFLFPTRDLLLATPALLERSAVNAHVGFNFNEAKVGMAWKF